MGDRFLIGNGNPRYKLILVGDVGVGKTALFWRYSEGQFLTPNQTMVTTIDFKMKCITINREPINLYVWDTAGSEKYRSIVSTYFKGCHGVLLVFDLSRYNSFKCREDSFNSIVEEWYPLAKSKTPQSEFLLVGNKIDLGASVDRDQVSEWAK